MSPSGSAAIFPLRAKAAATYGASSSALRAARAASRALNSGMTVEAKSSSASQMCSWRFLPPCWMKIVWSTPYSSNARRDARSSSGVPMQPVPPPSTSRSSSARTRSNLSQMSVRPGVCLPKT